MPFAHRPQTQDETASAFRHAGLVGVRDNAWIEQGRGFERILVQEVGADQLALHLGKLGVSKERVFHVDGARLEGRQQVAMAAQEVLQYVGQLVRRYRRVKRQHPSDDVIGARLVGRVEVTRFGRGLEWAHHYSCRVGTQVQRLTVQKGS